MASIDKQISDLETDLKAERELLESIRETVAKDTASYKELKAKKADLQAQLHETENAFAITTAEMKRNQGAFHNSEHRIADFETVLAGLKREKRIQELQGLQIDFWIAAEERLTTLMKDLNSGLEGFDDEPKEPKTILDKIKSIYEEPRSFGELNRATRQAIGFYEKSLRAICELKIDGKQIPLTAKQERFAVLDRYFQHPTVASLWS